MQMYLLESSQISKPLHEFTRQMLCMLAIHLHANYILEAWKHKLLKTGFKMHIF